MGIAIRTPIIVVMSSVPFGKAPNPIMYIITAKKINNPYDLIYYLV